MIAGVKIEKKEFQERTPRSCLCSTKFYFKNPLYKLGLIRRKGKKRIVKFTISLIPFQSSIDYYFDRIPFNYFFRNV